jgi:hypothetical protein
MPESRREAGRASIAGLAKAAIELLFVGVSE